MGRDYIETPVGSLPDHKFIGHLAQGKDLKSLPVESKEKSLDYLLEVYVDDYVALVISTSQEQLRHVANTIMMGVHNVFTPSKEGEEDPIAMKKLKWRRCGPSTKTSWGSCSTALKRQYGWRIRSAMHSSQCSRTTAAEATVKNQNLSEMQI